MTMTGGYGVNPNRDEMIRLIRSAVESGVTFFDTAETYGAPFTNEELVGEALQPFRNQVVIASKFGNNIDPGTGERGPGQNSQPEHIRIAVGENRDARIDAIVYAMPVHTAHHTKLHQVNRLDVSVRARVDQQRKA